MARTKDLTPLLARRQRRGELLGQLPAARQAVVDAEAEIGGRAVSAEESDRRVARLAERRATLAALYEGLAGLVWSVPYRAACEDAARALRDQAEEAMSLLAAVEAGQAAAAELLGGVVSR